MRRAAKLSQELLAHNAGVSTATIARIEQGRTQQPRADEFERIAKALGTTPDELMGFDEKPAEPDGEVTYADLVRRVQQVTGDRKVAIGFARASINWKRYSEAERKLLEAALEILPDAPEGPEDISKTEF